MTRHNTLPRPNIHTDLLPLHHWQASMQGPLVTYPSLATSTRHQVFPVYRIALDRSKCHASIILLIAIYKLAPFIVSHRIRIQHGEIRPSARQVVRLDIPKNRSGTVPAMRRCRVLRCREPVCVEVIPLRGCVFNQLNWFEVRVWRVESLKVQGTLLDTADERVALDRCGLGGADGVEG